MAEAQPVLAHRAAPRSHRRRPGGTRAWVALAMCLAILALYVADSVHGGDAGLAAGPAGPDSLTWTIAHLEAAGVEIDAEIVLPKMIIVSAARTLAAPSSRPAGIWADLEQPGGFTRLVEGDPGKARNDVRAVYLTASSAANPAFMQHVFELAASSQINAVVIDVKDNSGKTSYPSQLPAVTEIGAATTRIPDLAALLRQCEQHGLYTIGRLVVFADPVFAQAHPEFAVQTPGGGIWRDHTRSGWANPYATESWEYNMAIACEVASLGCREIQFDYVRFPSDGNLDLIRYPIKQELRPAEVIEAFLGRARQALAPYGAFLAADVFGLVTSFSTDMRIGQVLENVARQVDFVCPMMYPSHYAPGNYGIPDPDAEPYLTIRTGLTHALERMDGLGTVMVRPWLQDFSWRHRYGTDEVSAQIRAARELGVSGYMLWNPRNVYTEDAVR